MQDRPQYDCVVVGGGPAGLTCGLLLVRARRSVLLIDGGRPRNAASHRINGFLGLHGIRPRELLDRGRREFVDAGGEFWHAMADSAVANSDGFEVRSPRGAVQARRLVLAYGVRDVMPDLPGLDEYYGRSIFHCPDCDAYEFSDRRLGVIGPGDKGAGLALRLRQWTNRLSLFTHGQSAEMTGDAASRLQKESIAVYSDRIVELEGQAGRLAAVRLQSGPRIELDGIFFTLGLEPGSRLAQDLGCAEADQVPFLRVNDVKETSVRGVYAIGDLVPGSQLAITSAADGAVAAIAINKSLMPAQWLL